MQKTHKKNTFFIYNPKIIRYNICIYEMTFLNYKNVFIKIELEYQLKYQSKGCLYVWSSIE